MYINHDGLNVFRECVRRKNGGNSDFWFVGTRACLRGLFI